MSVPEHTSVRRYDVGSELMKPIKQSNGWMRAEGYIARTGVQTYRRADGSELREYRPPEEVFKADALATFELVPLTNDHPTEGLLDAENTSRYQVGTVVAPKRDGQHVRSQILVTDAKTVADMEKGKVQLSGGYLCDLEDAPGVTPEGERYDAIQRNIRGNHVALVAVGRAGPGVRVRMDSRDAVMIGSDLPIPNESATREAMSKINLDGVDYEVSETAAQAFVKVTKANADTLAAKDAEITALKASGEKLQAHADGADAEVKKLQAELAEAPAKLKAAAVARASLETSARKVLGDKVSFDGKTDAEIKLSVVETSRGTKLDGKSEAYIDAAFDLAVEHADGGALAAARAVTAPVGKQDSGSKLDEARRKFEELSRNAHKMGKK